MGTATTWTKFWRVRSKIADCTTSREAAISRVAFGELAIQSSSMRLRAAASLGVICRTWNFGMALLLVAVDMSPVVVLEPGGSCSYGGGASAIRYR